MHRLKLAFILSTLLLPLASTGDETAGRPAPVENLKRQLLDINRELFKLEQDILFPESSQLTVFVSLDVGRFFTLDSVKLVLDDEVVAQYLYTQRELAALRQGGVHQLFKGNLGKGAHEIVAFVVGQGPEGRDYKLGGEAIITKTTGPKFVELRIRDAEARQQPQVLIEAW